MISKASYKKIVETMPITCVEFILIHRRKFLLGKRANAPAKNKWWFPGGRILKNEKILNAVMRKIKEETGLSTSVITKIRFLTVNEVFFPDSAFKYPCHNINIIHAVTIKSAGNTRPDSQHSTIQWFSRIDKQWPKYVREVLASAGFK